MPDYGHDVRLGIFPSPNASSPQHPVELAVVADSAGIDLVSVQDHPYNAGHVDTWTLLSWIAARTTHVRVSPNVASLPLRPPVVLAKSAATLDLFSGGRVDLGLGTGAFWDGIVAAGGPWRSPGEAVDALVEAVDVIRQVWRGEGSVRVDGEHYRVRGLRSGPAPAGDIPLWIGAYKPRMLRVTGRLGDGWLPSMAYLPPEQLPEANARINEAALAAGRHPQDVVRLYNVHGRFGRGAGLLQGSPEQWAEQLAELVVDQGMSTFILATDDPADVRRFGLEVGPALRDLVDRLRSAPQAPLQHPGTEEVELAHGIPLGAGVPVTEDDGTRLTGELSWDEGARPSAPEPQDAPTSYTAEQLTAPQHLVEVHDHLRGELQRVREVIDQVRRGHVDVGQARSVITTMAMRQNNWTLGAFCESYCRMLTGHHTLEDRSVFPHLVAAEPALAPVVNRLEEEHEVIADVLDRLDRALVGLVDGDGYGQSGQTALEELSASVDLLTDTLLSHLSYEERELAGPLARHGFF